MLPKEWKIVSRYATGGHTQLDEEEIDFDIYKRARESMKMSGMKMLPKQEVQAGGVHLQQLNRQAISASNGFAIREFSCPMRHLCKCKFVCALLRGRYLCSFSVLECTTGRAMSLRRVEL